ncbi:MAG: M20/M25/M40 family metallo-hydrolase [Gemmatimonadaceae bacterium]|nr:M20/M25/M40 family metallo-hydrolase [Gemmatimonadaceae bacterium]
MTLLSLRDCATRLALCCAVAALLPIAALTAQSAYPTAWDATVLQRPDVRAALAHVERGMPSHIEEWIRIAEMPGKSRHEAQRGAYVKDVMAAEGLRVSVDSIGNVIGVRAGTGGGPRIVFAAHLDIVHALETNLTVRRAGDTLHGPGIFDNSASVANMLATIRALNAAKIRTKGDLIFIATVQEELGLRGMNYWFEHNPKPDLLISMDGGLGPINYGALGIYWTKYVFTSPGSHTVTSRGKPTPVKALSDAIARIYELRFPALPEGAVVNVGQVHGGVIFNGIPQELYFTVDLRSPDPVLLDSLDRTIGRIAQDAATKERVGLRVEVEQKNQAGGTTAQLEGARRHPLVQTAIDIQNQLGLTALPGAPEAIATGSTDGNVGVVRGVPSIAIGRSKGGNQHTLTEWADGPSALPATKLVLLLAVTFGDGVRTVSAPPVP